MKKIQNIIQKSNKDVYLIFWNNWEQLMPYLDLINKVSRKEVEVLFIGDYQSYKEWRFIKEGMPVAYFYNFNLPNLKTAFLEQQGEYPIFMKYDRSGNVSLQTEPFELLRQH